MERGRMAVRKREASRRVLPKLRPEVFADPGFWRYLLNTVYMMVGMPVAGPTRWTFTKTHGTPTFCA